jgi:hypothetical protein
MEWTDPRVRGFTRKYAARVSPCFMGNLDVEDLMQEFAICYLYVRKIFRPGESDAAFMSLLKQRYRWRVSDMLDQQNSRLRKVSITSVDDLGYVADNTSAESRAIVREALENAPREIIIYVEQVLNSTPSLSMKTGEEFIRCVVGASPKAFRSAVKEWGRDSLGLEL